MAVELAVAYVNLVPSAKGMGSSIAADLGAPLERAARESGDQASKAFGSRFADGVKKAAAVGGVAMSAALGKGFADSVSFEVSSDKLNAQLGATGEYAAQLGKVAGNLYSNAYGDSLGQVNEALKSVVQAGILPEDADAGAFEAITGKVISLSQAFDQDLGGVTAAVGQMLKTGLAKDADEALDIVTRGFQQGADKSGDLLDTLNEYGTQFRKVGIDGATATGLITQGLQAGARDADIVADAIKEFSIRAIDGSTATADGFKAVGLDAAQMATEIGKGGPAASAALDQVLDRLRAMPDPVQRSQAAVALFGTQAEDLGDALFKLDPSTAVVGLGNIAGAAAKVDQTLGSNTATTLEKLRRKFEVTFAGAADAIGPVLAVAPGLAGVATVSDKLGGALGKVAGGAASLAKGIGSGIKTVASFGVEAAKTTVRIVGQTAAFLAQKAAAVATAVAQKAMTAAQWALNAAMSANPITLIVIAIVALVAGLVIAYQKVGWFRDLVDAAFRVIKGAVEFAFNWVKNNWPLLLAILTGPIGLAVLAITKHWDTIKGAAMAVFDWVKTNWPLLLAIITGPVGLAVLALVKNWDAIKNGFTVVKDWIGDRISDIVGFFTGLGKRIGDAAKGAFDGLKNAFKSALNWIIRGWNSIEFKIPGFDPPGPGPKFGGFTLGVPNIPELHQGGTVVSPGMVNMKPAEELVMLPESASVVPLGPGAVGGISPTIHVHEQQRPRETARAVVAGFRRLQYHQTGVWA